MHKSASENDRERVRRAFHDAAGDSAADVAMLVAAVPAIMAEAERRRALVRPGLFDAMVPMARWAIPRLAAVTALLVLVSTLLAVRDASRAQATAASTLERLLLPTAAGATPDEIEKLLAEPEASHV